MRDDLCGEPHRSLVGHGCWGNADGESEAQSLGLLLPVSAKALDQMPDDTTLQLPAMGGVVDAGKQSTRFARDDGGALVEVAAR